MMRGTLSPFYGLLAAVGAGAAGKRAIQASVIRSLTSDFGDTTMSALYNRSWQQLGRTLVNSTATDLTNRALMQREPGQLTPQPRPEPEKKIGPMSRDIERKQARQIATERGREDPTHVDQIQDLNRQVASGDTPDIHHDLNSGRLSYNEVQKLVQPRPADPSALFQGMNLADAVDAFG